MAIYQVIVHTGNIPYAGTDSSIWLWFDGTAGRSGWLYPDNPENNFEQNSTDYFYFTLPDLGTLTSAWVYFSPGGGGDWFLDTVTVNGSTFSYYNWITSEGIVQLRDAVSSDFTGDTSGDNVYIVDDVRDKVPESDQLEPTPPIIGGIDRVESSISYTLGATIENLTLTGSSAINGAGNSLNNTIRGNSANNELSGFAGHDNLYGNRGNDTIKGGEGNDLLDGGSGKDHLWGQSGWDIFDYNSVTESPAGAGRDVIHNFDLPNAAGGDRIDLSTIDANATLAGNQAFAPSQLTYAAGILNVDVANFGGPVDMQIEITPAPGALNDTNNGWDIIF